jgi:hypothetical protein
MDKSCNEILKSKKKKVAKINKETTLKQKKIVIRNKKITLKRKKVVSPKVNKQKASSKISRIMKRRNYLISVCPDSGECLAIGREMKTIRDFFNGFSDFDYLETPVKRVAKGNNGFVNELKFNREGYSSYTILKSSQRPGSDNLMYEYQVGQYINKLCNYFPCFLETYALYYYNDEASWRKIANRVKNASDVFKKSLKKETHNDYGKACEQSKYSAILIQHVNKAKSLHGLFKEKKQPFINLELPFILFQIYYTLSLLSSTFTHYDLHLDNVLIYELDSSKYIHYYYHLSDGTIVSFKSKYVVKLIDYGRSYFNDVESNIDSKKIRQNELCKIQKCKPNCGENYGFGWLKKKLASYNFFIDSTNPNPSHDLRLFNEMKLYNIDKFILDANFLNIFRQMKYGVDIIDNKYKRYGTRPLPDSYLLNGQIQTVKDMFLALFDLLLSGPFMANNDIKYRTYSKIGDLHVYGKSSPMKYEPV